jgi:hypothetical protein
MRYSAYIYSTYSFIHGELSEMPQTYNSNLSPEKAANLMVKEIIRNVESGEHKYRLD